MDLGVWWWEAVIPTSTYGTALCAIAYLCVCGVWGDVVWCGLRGTVRTIHPLGCHSRPWCYGELWWLGGVTSSVLRLVCTTGTIQFRYVCALHWLVSRCCVLPLTSTAT